VPPLRSPHLACGFVNQLYKSANEAQFRILDLLFAMALAAIAISHCRQELQLLRQQRQLDLTSKATLENCLEYGRVLNDVGELRIQNAILHNRLEAHMAGCCV